jgi:hypothetical protein
MTRIAALTVLTLAATALIGCGDDEELAEDPPLAVPGHAVTQPPGGIASVQPLPSSMPTSFDPELAVPGQPRPLPMPQPQLPPGMQPGQMPPGMQPGQMPPGMQPGQMPPGMQPGQVPPGMDPSQMQPGMMQPGQPPPGM